MNDRRHEDSENLPTAQIEAHLRELGAIGPPDGLKDRLAATIPAAGAYHGVVRAVPRWGRPLRYLGAAAAVIVVASVVIPRLATPSGPPRLTTDINDRSHASSLLDYNLPQPHDSNVFDNNAVP